MKSQCVECFKTLSVPTRFKIYKYIRNRKNGATVNQIAEYIHLRQPTVTFHLNELAERKLIKKHKEGKCVYCKTHIRCKNNCPLYGASQNTKVEK